MFVYVIQTSFLYTYGMNMLCAPISGVVPWGSGLLFLFRVFDFALHGKCTTVAWPLRPSAQQMVCAASSPPSTSAMILP